MLGEMSIFHCSSSLPVVLLDGDMGGRTAEIGVGWNADVSSSGKTLPSCKACASSTDSCNSS